MDENNKTSDNGKEINALIVKIKLKGFLIGGILCYINLQLQKIEKVESIICNNASLLVQFEVNRTYKVLEDILFAIKFRGEKYDAPYTNQFNDLLMEELSKKEKIETLIKLAKEGAEQKLNDFFVNIFKYTITNYFEVVVGCEFINFNFSKISSSEVLQKYQNAFEVVPVTSPIKGVPAPQLKKEDKIYVKFEDKTPMGQYIKQQLQAIAANEKEESDENNKNPILVGTIKEMTIVEVKSVKMFEIIVEISNEIYGRCTVPLTLKIKKYNAEDEMQKTTEETKSETEITIQDNKKQEHSLKIGCIVSIFVLIIIAIIIFFL